jgi:hypothetical protein
VNVTRREALSVLGVALPASVLLTEAGCSSDIQTVLTIGLGVIVAAATALVNDLAPNDTWAQNLLAQITKATDDTDTELESSDSGAEKLLKIASYWAFAASTVLPTTGISSVVAGAVAVVLTAIATYLASIKGLAAQIQATPEGSQAFQASGAKALKVTRGDRRAIANDIKPANAMIKAKLAALKSGKK